MKIQNEKKKYPIPELLAPVGGRQQFWAAVNNGADAVYLGGSRFNARQKADNFGPEEMKDTIAFAHQRNVKVYVTMNTLLKDFELGDALEYAAFLWETGADALIIQDMGLARLLVRHLPEFPLHLSTQGTVYNAHALDLAGKMGFSRIVPARELSLEGIRNFTEEAHRRKIETEVFVHGALCMCYSGQCQMSRVLGAGDTGRGSARSANRGLCAQPCRLAYRDDQGETGYFLSPRDLCLLEEIPQISGAGVDSLKIEGRMKSPEYVALTTRIYRKYLDQYSVSGRISVTEEDHLVLRQIYSRGEFTKGYFCGETPENFRSGNSPGHRGIPVGRVKNVLDKKTGGLPGEVRAACRGAEKKGAQVIEAELNVRVNLNDVIQILPPEEDRKTGKGWHESAGNATGRITYMQKAGKDRWYLGDIQGDLRPGGVICRLTDGELMKEARLSFCGESVEELDRSRKRRISVRMHLHAWIGKPPRLVLEEGRYRVEIRGEKDVEEALHRPTDPMRVRQQLSRLGGTPFETEETDIRVDMDDGAILPASAINSLRREAVRELLEKKSEAQRAPAGDSLRREVKRLRTEKGPAPEGDGMKQEAARLRSREGQAEEWNDPGRKSQKEQDDHGRSDAKDQRKNAKWLNRLPAVPLEEWMNGAEGIPEIFPVSMGKLDVYIEENFQEIVDRAKATGIIIGNLGWIKQFLDAGVDVYAGRGLNLLNKEAGIAFAEMGVRGAMKSWECADPGEKGLPLMILEYPLQTKTLTDRKGVVHRVERSPSGDKTVIY